MWRKLIKTGAASVLHWSGAAGLLARAGAKSAPIVIGYHRVVEDFRAQAQRTPAPMLISVQSLERHLDWLGRRFDFITLDDVAAWAEGGRRFERPAVAVTFDDGYADLYHHAFPLLTRKGIPAAVFVVTGLLGTARLLNHDELYLLLARACAHWRDAPRRFTPLLRDLGMSAGIPGTLAAADPARLTAALLAALSQEQLRALADVLRGELRLTPAAADELRMLDWDMLQQMSRRGLTVGSHTCTHARLTHERWEAAVAETRDSRAALESALGAPVEHFAYPGGDFNATVVRAVAQAGYRCGYTSCRHRDAARPALTIPRRLLWERACADAFERFSPAVMNCHLGGVFEMARPCRQAHAS